jgi:hypothetical protein
MLARIQVRRALIPRRPSRVEGGYTAAGYSVRPVRRGGAISLVLKAFLLIGTIGLIVWAGTLPDNGQQDPVGWDLLLVALIGAALTLLVLRLLRRMRPLLLPYVVWAVRRLRGEGPVSDVMESVLVVVAILGFSVAVVGLIVVAVLAALGHGHAGVPEAAVLVSFCVGVGARVVLWAMGRDEFPFFGDGGT